MTSDEVLILICVGLTLAIPAACWFGIFIGEQRAIDRIMKRRELRLEEQEERNPGGQAWGPWA